MTTLKQNYPSWICSNCGKQYGDYRCEFSTWHNGDPNDSNDCCGWCGSKESLTEPRDFSYPKAPIKKE